MKKRLMIYALFVLSLIAVLMVTSCEHEHTYGEWTVDKDPTCTEDGSQFRVCECGDKETETLYKIGHEAGEWTTVVNATCLENGTKHRVCLTCDEIIDTGIIKARGKHYYQSKVTVEATCAEAGVETFTCVDCGDSYTKAIDKKSHKYTVEVTEATCSSAGAKTFTCSGCGKVNTTVIEKTEHTYTSKVTTKATCTKNGVKTFTCSACGDSYTSVIGKTKHSYTSKVTTKATCTKNGVETFTCSACGDSYTSSIAALGHKWSSATCTKAKKCSSCGTTSGSALGHDYDYNGKCRSCGATAEATIKLPKTPATISYYGYGEKIESQCKITEISVSLYSSSSSGLWYEITFKGTCIYNKNGSAQSSYMKIGYKLYDSEGYVISSGTAYSEAVAEGEKFKETINVYYLTPGKTYTLVILDVN